MATTQQYAFRSLKQLGVAEGSGDYTALAPFQRAEANVRTFAYSPDSRLFAYCSGEGVFILNAEAAEPVQTLPLKGVIDIAFSPKGTFLQTWERQIKVEDGSPPQRNLRVWNVETGTEVAAFSQKNQNEWQLHFTRNESHALRSVTNEVHVYEPATFDAGIVNKVRLEGVTSISVSPGQAPNVALFVAEKKGAPASVKIYALSALETVNSSKTFYKADKITMKWSKTGSHLLFLTATDVDKTGKSYYGETNLYLLSSKGDFDCRVALDKEGGIHDFAWSPSSKEFAVTYGYMPAKTVLFDLKVNTVHDFGLRPCNFLAYNPQGRLMCIAGFGNLAGKIDVYDRKTLKLVSTFEAPNTSHCEWSPDGRFLMCATLSPRLRVDNGVRIYHFTGGLMHVQTTEELYQVGWRPFEASKFPFEGALGVAPKASIAVASTPVKAAAPTGAYRPPHARGTATPTMFKREDEGGVAYSSNGGSAFGNANGSGRTSPNFSGRNARAPKTIPGAAPPAPTGVPGAAEPAPAEEGEGKSRREKKKANKKKNAVADGAKSTEVTPAGTPRVPTPEPPPPPAAAAAEQSLSSQLSPLDKKKRAVQKKLTAIDQLKIKQKFGEKLELTQLKKLETEAELRKELAALDLEK